MSEPQHDNDLAVKFLRSWSMNGPWALVAINTDRHGIQGRVFKANEEDELRTWLDEQNKAQRNCYFHVNTVHDKIRDKAGREDVLQVTHLHVDIDPRAGEDVASEQQRILALADGKLPQGVPQPTWVNFSGGGYQLFWELDEPIKTGGNIEEAERVKLYNLQLEVLFKADNCHNIDRIMRLPGTINVPDAKKKAKGRTKQLAQVVAFHEDRVYSIDQFTPAAQIQVDTGFASTVPVQIEGNIERAESIETLKGWAQSKGHTFPDWACVLIVQGNDPEHPAKYLDRSKAVLAACCEMARAEFTDTQIFSVITDPDFGISASVLDKGSGVDRYAKRQIERAKEFVISPELLELNERHAVISSYGGKCVIIQEQWDDALKRNILDKQTFGDFKNRYINRRIDVGDDKRQDLGSWWIFHPNRRQYEGITFAPGGCSDKIYNLWQGFTVDPIPGDCSMLLEHMRKNICGGVQEYYEFLLNWMARAVQLPGEPAEIAVILRGRQGVGKGRLVQYFGELFGRHFLQVSDPKHLVGSFNAHLRDCVVLFGDEAFFAGDKKHEGVLKTLVTEKHLMVEPKGVDVGQVVNCLHLIMASNSDWIVPAGTEERRFFVLDCKPYHMQDRNYFTKIDKQMKTGGSQAFLHVLKTRDISGFDFRTAPKTDALKEQKELSMSAEMSWWYEKLTAGELLPRAGGWTQRAPVEALHQDYVQYMQDLGKYHRSTKTVLGRFLNKVNPPTMPRRRMETCPDTRGVSVRQPVYHFSTLTDVRKYWDDLYFHGEWIEDPDADSREQEAPF